MSTSPVALDEDARTLVVGSLPVDTMVREIRNLFVQCPGFESCQLLRQPHKTVRVWAFVPVFFFFLLFLCLVFSAVSGRAIRVRVCALLFVRACLLTLCAHAIWRTFYVSSSSRARAASGRGHIQRLESGRGCTRQIPGAPSTTHHPPVYRSRSSDYVSVIVHAHLCCRVILSLFFFFSLSSDTLLCLALSLLLPCWSCSLALLRSARRRATVSIPTRRKRFASISPRPSLQCRCPAAP